jgi:hypothetical protein
MLTLREKHEYEAEIADLKLRLSIALKANKVPATRTSKTITRSENAMVFIQMNLAGKIKVSLQEIADMTFISYGCVKKLSAKFKKLQAMDA